MHPSSHRESFFMSVYYGVCGIFSLVLFFLIIFHILVPFVGNTTVWDKKSGYAFVVKNTSVNVGDTLVAYKNEEKEIAYGMVDGHSKIGGSLFYRLRSNGYNDLIPAHQSIGVFVFSMPIAGVFLEMMTHPFGKSFLLWMPLIMILLYIILTRFFYPLYPLPENSSFYSSESKKEKEEEEFFPQKNFTETTPPAMKNVGDISSFSQDQKTFPRKKYEEKESLTFQKRVPPHSLHTDIIPLTKKRILSINEEREGEEKKNEKNTLRTDLFPQKKS
jgi:hypothetical protein